MGLCQARNEAAWNAGFPSALSSVAIDVANASRPPKMRTLRAAAFLDRDGVLNVDCGYAYKLTDLELIPGAAEGVKRLNSAGFLVVIVTNQSGIGLGYYSQSDMEIFNQELCNRLAEAGGHIDAIYFSPHHPEAIIERYRKNHPDRKPRPGMIIRACREFGIDPLRSFLIGDKASDLEAAKAADVAGYLFNGNNLEIFIADILCKEKF